MNLKQLIQSITRVTRKDIADGVVLKLLMLPTAHWNNKPDFTIDSEIVRGDYVIHVDFTDDRKGNKQYQWLDEGTSVRRVTLSRDWVNKTIPGTFFGGTGRGKVVGWGHHRGIDAREWTKMASEQSDKILGPRIDKLIKSYIFPKRKA